MLFVEVSHIPLDRAFECNVDLVLFTCSWKIMKNKEEEKALKQQYNQFKKK